jgi:hypothetical protein
MYTAVGMLLLCVVLASSILVNAVGSVVGSTDTARIIYVAVDGDDSASGAAPATALASCAAAVRLVSMSCSDLPSGGIEVRFAPGRYKLTDETACGTISCSASADAPIVFRSARGGGEVIFDFTTQLDTSMMRRVTNHTILSLLNPAATGAVRELPVDAATGWTGVEQTLQWGELPLTPSVWPNNHELGYIQEIYDAGAIYCPGRTKGPVPVCQVCMGDETSSPTKPCGANFSLTESPTGAWERELVAGPGFGGKQVTLEGYVGADWFHETHTIVRVVRTNDGANTSVQLGESSHYGICEASVHRQNRPAGCTGGDQGGAPGRFRVHGLLSNVDQPGEYFYDRASRVLYLIPPSDASEHSAELGFWAGESGERNCRYSESECSPRFAPVKVSHFTKTETSAKLQWNDCMMTDRVDIAIFFSQA